MCVRLCLCGYAHVNEEPVGARTGHQISLVLEVLASCPKCVLGTELRSSGRIVSESCLQHVDDLLLNNLQNFLSMSYFITGNSI